MMMCLLGGALELAPTLFEATAGYVASTVSDGAGAAVGGRTTGRGLTAEADGTRVVAVHHVAGAATADVVDGCSTAQVTLEFLIEAEYGALTGAVDVAGTAATRCEG